MHRMWVGLGADPAAERVAADTDPERARPVPGCTGCFSAGPATSPPRGRGSPAHAVRAPAWRVDVYRVRIEAGGEALGSDLGGARARRR